MKILLLGDASNYHRSLSLALKRLGHDVTVASNGSNWMQTERDIDLSRKISGKLGGLALWIKLKTTFANALKEYDIVQISNPIFLDLKPHRVKEIFDFIKRHNSAVFLTALGTDTPYINMCLDQNSPLEYNEWIVNGEKSPLSHKNPEILDAWQQDPLKSHCNYIYNNIDGAISALYEYNLACEYALPKDKIAYAGIPIDTKSLTPSVSFTEIPHKIKLFLGMHNYRKEEKGTDRLLYVAKKVVNKHPDKCELKIVENLPYTEYIDVLRHSHVLLDQLYSYTPATNALIGMAYGLTTVTGGEDEYYNFIGETDNRPIINAIPDNEQLFNSIERIVLHPEEIPIRARQSRDFVIKHNDCKVVAQRFINTWNKRLNIL